MFYKCTSKILTIIKNVIYNLPIMQKISSLHTNGDTYIDFL